MLSEQQCELITAFLDGELDRRERKLALRLLRHSGEARALLQRLQEDAHHLQLLPQRKLPADFSQTVLGVMRARGLQPKRPAKLPLRPRMIPAWLGVAAAAAVLLCVGTGSFLAFDALFPPTKLVSPVVELPKEKEAEEPGLKQNPVNPLIPNFAAGALAEFARPVEVQLALQDLRQPQAMGRLTEELRRDTSYQVNVSVRNHGQTVQRLQTVMQKQGIQVFMDSSVQNQIRKPQPKQPVSFVLYTENLQAEEVAGWLEQLGKDEPATPSSAQHNGSVLLAPLSTKQRTYMSQMLGVSVKALAPPERQGRIELPMPVHMEPDGDKKPEVKKGQGTPKVKQTPTKNRFAVVLAVTPGANVNPMASRAVKDFLAKRQAQRPGTLQVMVVVNQLT